MDLRKLGEWQSTTRAGDVANQSLRDDRKQAGNRGNADVLKTSSKMTRKCLLFAETFCANTVRRARTFVKRPISRLSANRLYAIGFSCWCFPRNWLTTTGKQTMLSMPQQNRCLSKHCLTADELGPSISSSNSGNHVQALYSSLMEGILFIQN